MGARSADALAKRAAKRGMTIEEYRAYDRAKNKEHEKKKKGEGENTGAEAGETAASGSKRKAEAERLALEAAAAADGEQVPSAEGAAEATARRSHARNRAAALLAVRLMAASHEGMEVWQVRRRAQLAFGCLFVTPLLARSTR